MRNWLIVLLALAVGVAAGYGLSRPASKSSGDKNATETAPAVPAEIRAEGRVMTYPGAWLTLSSEQGGTLVELHCVEKQPVHQGEVLAVLRRDEDRAAVAEARAQVGVAEADLRLAGAEARRALDLAAKGFYSRQSVDKAEQSLAAARARLDSARATARKLEAVLAKTTIVAPFSGTVIERLADDGETVSAGQGICNIADMSRMRVEAEVDEFDAGKVHVGDSVKITAEGYAGPGWRGKVEEIPDSVTAPRLRPQDPAKPTDTRVLLVKVALPEPLPLKLGQRVEVRIGGL